MALRLERVGPDLVAEPDPAALLAQVQEHPPAAQGDVVEGAVELRATVALERPEHLAREALGVDADGDRLGAAELAHHHGDVLDAGAPLPEHHRPEEATLRRERRLGVELEETLPAMGPAAHRHDDAVHPGRSSLVSRHEMRFEITVTPDRGQQELGRRKGAGRRTRVGAR